MILYHADDYGISVNASKEILNLVQMGKLSGISVIPNMSCFDECVKLLLPVMKEHPELTVALHLNFFEGHCCADPTEVPLLVDENGYFKCSWMYFFKSSYQAVVRGRLRKQLSIEIQAQIRKLCNAMPPEYILCLDSHQHSHMIPVVWDAMRDVVLLNHINVQYIRISKEPLAPYLCAPALYPTYPPINIIKNMIIRFCSLHTENHPIISAKGKYYLWGLIMGGAMDEKRIKKLMKRFQRYGQEPDTLELLFHPGTILPEELTPEYNNPGFREAETSPKRKREYESVILTVQPFNGNL